MKTIPILFLWFASCVLAMGAGTINGVTYATWNGLTISSWNGTGVSVGSGGGTDYSPYAFSEDFEGPGFENSWTNPATTMDEDYAADPAPLDGSYSGRYLQASGTNVVQSDIGGSALDAVTVAMTINGNGVWAPNDVYLIAADDGAFNGSFYITKNYLGNFGIGHGGSQGNGSVAIADGTFYIWIEYSKNTGGNNGVLRLYVSPTKTKPATPDINITNGTATAGFRILTFQPAGASDFIVDHIRIKSGATAFADWPL